MATAITGVSRLVLLPASASNTLSQWGPRVTDSPGQRSGRMNGLAPDFRLHGTVEDFYIEFCLLQTWVDDCTLVLTTTLLSRIC